MKSMYRKEPIISFMVTGGIVNVALGGLTEHWSLMSVGLSVVGVAIALWARQSLTRRRAEPTSKRPPVYVLPPASSSTLPMLNVPKKNPPNR